MLQEWAFENYTIFVTDRESFESKEFKEYISSHALKNAGADLTSQEEKPELFCFSRSVTDTAIMSIVVVNPTDDDAGILIGIANHMQDEKIIDSVMNHLSELKAGHLSKEEEYHRRIAFMKSIGRIIARIQSSSEKKVCASEPESYALYEYSSLEMIARDPFANPESIVYSYNNHFFTDSRSSEFAYSKAKLRNSVLSEHAVNLGTVKTIQSIFV